MALHAQTYLKRLRIMRYGFHRADEHAEELAVNAGERLHVDAFGREMSSSTIASPGPLDWRRVQRAISIPIKRMFVENPDMLASG